ncbi:pyridoxine/pyridoxamine 5'-phosphate oxidase-like isoform X1 [Mercenaria mercenaria]|uniref:pyridoxine/pyridoxamine 5'-phosphate oxidase-like isoform X1 n=1 Tax=Mercenaria mercenaria TaxID=6596 RepID=UPI00234F074B|nr:pyridoxine/pyridoxamine 5'-phosphate oxidase-like isoform X1 [Mercenaria mercenaria]
MADLSGMRQPYHRTDSTFDVIDLASKDPMKQFEAWFEDTCKDKLVQEPNAMALATASRSGIPSVRMVLCKGFSTEGFTFYTNYESRKGRELDANPNCSLMFYWEPLKRSIQVQGVAERVSEEKSRSYFASRPLESQIGALVSHQGTVLQSRQIRIEGKVEKVSKEKSINYFNSRPKESQLGAIVSNQSTVIPDRTVLDTKLKELKELYSGEDVSIPKPDYWGGYLVRPNEMEFWQGQTNRLHDRLKFRKLKDGETFNDELMVKAEGDWIIERLSS